MKNFNKKAFSVIEYAVLIVIIISAFLILRDYIQRGIYGMWHGAGKSIGFERQYDPQKTIECAFDEQSNRWYDRACFEQYVGNLTTPCGSGDIDCEETAINACVTAGLSECGKVVNEVPK